MSGNQPNDNEHSALIDAAIGLPKEEKKRRNRKTKKMNEKELLHTMFNGSVAYDEEDEEDTLENAKTAARKKPAGKTLLQQKRLFENIQHLTAAEKKKLETNFTKPKNKHQEQYVKTLRADDKKIIIATGPAGTGKTLFATEFAIRGLLTNEYDKIIFTRPSVSVDEELGFLPGTLEEKMAPWVRPIYDILHNFISPKEIQLLMEDKIIEIAPLGYMRGRTFKNAWIVADEMQNSTVSQMKMLLTRLGEKSRLVITGDLEQHDRIDGINGLDDFLDKLRGKRSDSISSFEFDNSDIQREDVVREVLEIYASRGVPPAYCDGDPTDPA
jgi:phosphate starvation-inducible PhoH-like protein